ncbi:MAG TPA: HIT family protein [Chlamydiales bacterium]|nr:HIT family protein [Chlamydiales bacterium]
MAEKIDFQKLKIKEYLHWTLYLNEYQCYLGRVCLVAKREGASDFIEITQAEREEFFSIGKQVKKALEKLFQPDLMNYAALGNVFRHLHVHLIPRYEKERIFNGITFVDKRWGKNYAPYDREFQLSIEELNDIKNALSVTIQHP